MQPVRFRASLLSTFAGVASLFLLIIAVLPRGAGADPGDQEPNPAAGATADDRLQSPLATLMPMEPPPPPRRAPGAPEDESRILTLDRATGLVRERSVDGLKGLIEPYTRAGFGIDQLLDDPEGVAKNFSTWSEVANPAIGYYPRRVKLFLYYGGNTSGGHCSGTLIDPQHVLTAAHCVYKQDLSAFIDSVQVIPGYEQGQRPFGTAREAQIHVWTLWTEDYDYDHDVAVIDLDHPIGALTGWWGWGYDNDCDSWESSIWRHEGYPAEAPYTGELMYENAGSFDDCSQDGWDNRASWDGPTWGGTSGSGALKTTTGAIYAVLSTSDRSTVTVDCKVTETKFAQIGQMIAEDTPPEPDLIVMDANGPEEIESGNRMAWLDFAVFNYSSAAVSGTWTYRAYLSTDDSWSMDDVDMGPGSFVRTFAPQSGARITADVPPLIPPVTQSGTYFVIVSLVAPDWNNANNTGNGWNAHQIVVICPPAWPPALGMPIDGQICVAPDVLFTWNPVAPYADYQLQVGESCDGGTVVETSMTSHSWYGLSLGTTYYWRVRTRADCGDWGVWSACRSFRTAPNPAVVSTVVSPDDGEHCQGGSRFVLDWSPLPDAATYDLQLSPVYCYEGSITTGITGTTLAMPGLLPNTTYYWRVRAHTVCGQTTDWSSTPGFCWTFKTAPVLVAAPVRIGPGDGTACGSSSTVLSWNHIDDWDHYEVQIGTSCGVGSVGTTTSNTYTPSGLQSGLVYYWRVRAFHECGLVSDWTSCWSFSLDLEPPTNPTSLTSSSHTVGVWSTTDNTVSAQWNWGYDNCAGSWPQYATLWDRSAATAPTVVTTYGEFTAETSPPLPDGNDHWFHVRTVDYAGNYAAETLHLGPFWIDMAPPTAPGYDYATLDGGQTLGPTQLSIDWLPSTDATSGVAGYSYLVGGGATPPVTLDNTVETTDLTATSTLGKEGANYFHVRGVDVAGLGSTVLTHGPITIDPSLFGIYFLAPLRGNVLVEGTVYSIRWELYDGGPPAAQSGRLDYSLDAGATYVPIDTDLTPEEIKGERYFWTVPMASSEEAVLRLRVIDTAGHVVYVRSQRFTLQKVTAAPDRPAPDGLVLETARPNPFNPLTTICFTLPRTGPVRLAVYDLSGHLVRVLMNEVRAAGSHEIQWDGTGDHGQQVASGVYVCRMEADSFGETRRMTLVK